MSSYALYTLRDLRVAGERQAERALAEAASAVRRAEAERDRLGACLVQARAAVAAARGEAPAAVSATRAQTVRRFWARLEAAADAAVEAIDRHAMEVLTPAVGAEASARAAHLRARQRREVVDKAIARREAVQRRDRERREEIAADDLGARPKK